MGREEEIEISSPETRKTGTVAALLPARRKIRGRGFSRIACDSYARAGVRDDRGTRRAKYDLAPDTGERAPRYKSNPAGKCEF